MLKRDFPGGPVVKTALQCKGCGFDSWLGFPGGSDGKESACIAGDPGLISGLGNFPSKE